MPQWCVVATTMLWCHNATIPQCGIVATTMSQWHNATMTQCYNDTMWQCDNVTMTLCDNDTMPQCDNATMHDINDTMLQVELWQQQCYNNPKYLNNCCFDLWVDMMWTQLQQVCQIM